jgi:multidrug efflux pump subunit AcrA (membrane-fusion protein)
MEASRLQPGTRAEVTFSDLAGDTFQGELRSVGQVADPSHGTYELEVWIQEATGRLRDGLVAEIEFPEATEAPTLLAHRAALLRRSGRPEAFVVDRNGTDTVANLRSVRTGRSSGEWIEILEGLTAGEELIVEGQFALRDGALVVIDGAAPPPAGGATHL